MIGAMVGDVIGSVHEGTPTKRKDLESEARTFAVPGKASGCDVVTFPMAFGGLGLSLLFESQVAGSRSTVKTDPTGGCQVLFSTAGALP
jgi:hypothetical protein